MKLQIDSNLKTISLEENVNLKEFFKVIKELLPKDSPLGYWEDFNLKTNTSLNWGYYPVYINPRPYLWWQSQPTITYSQTNALSQSPNIQGIITLDTTSHSSASTGVYNVEVN